MNNDPYLWYRPEEPATKRPEPETIYPLEVTTYDDTARGVRSYITGDDGMVVEVPIEGV